MFTLDQTVLKNMNPSDPRKYALYEQMQEEICNVIDFMGGSPLKRDQPEDHPHQLHHQLYDAISQLALESPRKWTMDFFPTPRVDPVELWNNQRITRLIDNFQLDPLHNWAVTFRISYFEQSKKDSNAGDPFIPTFDLIQSQRVQLTYEDKIGTWFSAHQVWEVGMPHPILSSDQLGLILLPSADNNQHQDPSQFFMSISPSGYISITSSTFEFLSVTRLVLSEFRFVRRPT